jgi:elongation factor G
MWSIHRLSEEFVQVIERGGIDMKDYSCENIRNICLLGHGNAGKTTLAEAMLNLTGATDRFGSVVDGNTVMDYDPEEIKRKFQLLLLQ